MDDLSGATAEGSLEFSLNYKEQAEAIAANGNNPEDWRAYIEFLKDRLDLIEEGKKNKLLVHLYRMAVKAIPESCKTLSKAQLLIDFAEFQRTQDPKDAEKILSIGHRTLRHHSVIHIACADLELKKGNKDKALRILQQALAIGSDPPGIIHSSMDRITQVRNLESSFSPDSGKDSSGEMTGSQLSGHFENGRECLRQATPGRLNTLEFQQGLDLATQALGQQSISSSNQAQSYHNSLHQTHARDPQYYPSQPQNYASQPENYAPQSQNPASHPQNYVSHSQNYAPQSQNPASPPKNYASQPSLPQSEQDRETSAHESPYQRPSTPKLLSLHINKPDKRSHVGLRSSSGVLLPNPECGSVTGLLVSRLQEARAAQAQLEKENQNYASEVQRLQTSVNLADRKIKDLEHQLDMAGGCLLGDHTHFTQLINKQDHDEFEDNITERTLRSRSSEGKFDYLEFTRTLKHGAKEKDEEGQGQGEEVTAEDKGHVEEGAEGVQC